VGKTDQFTEEQIIAALRKSRGMVHKAADLLGCHHQTIYNYRDKYPAIKEAIEHERGLLLDLAESGLYDAVKKKSPWAIAFTLKTIGKERGYVEKQEVVFVKPDKPVSDMTDEELAEYERSLKGN
jgi:hypothetical protein